MQTVLGHKTGYRALRVQGDDALTWLNGLLTCDVLGAKAGRAVRGVLLTKQGKIDGECYVLVHQDTLFLAVAGGDAAHLATTLDSYLVMEDAEIHADPAEFCWLFGAHAEHVLRSAGVTGAKCDVFTTPAWLCAATQEEVERLHTLPNISWMSDEEYDAFRIESKLARYGVDFDSTDNLHAASLEKKVVDWSKGCYLGQEVVCMQEMRGKVRKSLVTLLGEVGTELHPGDLKNEQAEVVGRCTSAAGIHGLAQVRAPENASGTRLSLIAEGEPERWVRVE